MMSAFKLHTLKQKLWAIVVASFVARVIMFFVLPNTPSTLAPDEGTYADVAEVVSNGTLESDTGFYKLVYNISRTLILSAQPLMSLGFNGLDAVRIVSTFFGLLGLAVIVSVLLKLIGLEDEHIRAEASYQRNIVFLVSIFAFLPSHFVWSNLALRESATELGLILSFVTFYLFLNSKLKLKIFYLIFLCTSLIFTFYVRPQVGWVLTLSLIISLLFNLKEKTNTLALFAIAGGILAGTTIPISGTPNSAGTSSGLVSGFTPVTSAGDIISIKQNVNQLDAASAIKTTGCPLESDRIEHAEKSQLKIYFCIAWRSPYMAATFLFRPIIGFDVTSRSSLFAAGENMIWIILFVYILYLGIKRRSLVFLRTTAPSLIFLTIYVIAASAYEGNMGTAFRHKSLILWIVLFLLFNLFPRQDVRTKTPYGNNSQESAV